MEVAIYRGTKSPSAVMPRTFSGGITHIDGLPDTRGNSGGFKIRAWSVNCERHKDMDRGRRQ